MIEYYQKFKPYLRQYAILFVVNLNMVTLGLSTVWTSPMLVKLSDATQTVLDKPLTTEEGSWIAPANLISAVISSFIAGYLTNNLGRKHTMILANMPRIICYIMVIFANKAWIIILAKFINGFGDGLIYIAANIYSTEIASPEIRGRCGIFLHILVSTGFLLMMGGGPYLSYFTVNTITLGLNILFTVPLLLIPETPNLLFKKGKSEEALETLMCLRGSLDAAKSELIDYASTKDDQSITLKEIIKSKIILKYLFIVVILGGGTHLSGMSSISMYMQTILISADTSVSSGLMSLFAGAIGLMGTCCSVFTVDRFGRKPVCIVGLVGNIIGLICLATHFQLVALGVSISGLLNYLPIASMMVAMFFYHSGMAAVYPLICAELFDARIRSLALSVCLLSSNATVFMITKVMPLLNEIISPAYVFWMFSLCSILFLLFIIVFIPETKGKSFREIQMEIELKQGT